MGKKIVVVGNGGYGTRERPSGRECTLTKDLSEFVDSADEVIRFQTCTNYESKMLGTKTTGLVTRDLFSPHVSALYSPHGHLYIPKEVVEQIQQFYVIVSGSFFYETPFTQTKDRQTHDAVRSHYRPPVKNLREFYELSADVSPYYDRYPALKSAEVIFVHQHDARQYYRRFTPQQAPSIGFLFLYYLMYYTSKAILDDIYLVGFEWEYQYHNIHIEKQFVDDMVEQGLIKEIL
jgi:hypothetical protein